MYTSRYVFHNEITNKMLGEADSFFLLLPSFLFFFSLKVRSNFFQMFVMLMEKRKSSVKENKTNLNFTCHCFKTISTTAMFFMKAVNSILALF